MNNITRKLAAIQKNLREVRGKMATKEDLKSMATKTDIKNMATKNDLKTMATKTDLKNLEVRLLDKMDESEMEIIAAVDKHKADKETVGILEKRVDRLEDNAGLPPID